MHRIQRVIVCKVIFLSLSIAFVSHHELALEAACLALDFLHLGSVVKILTGL